MHPKDHQPFSRSRRCGFNLVEVAIVLGVVGLVIGGIWWAASAIQTTNSTSEALKGILMLKNGIQNAISRADSCSIGDIPITQSAIQIGAIPNNWINGSNVIPPFGTSMTIDNRCTGGERFDIKIYGIKGDVCYRLLRAINQNFSTSWGDGINKGEMVFLQTKDGSAVQLFSTTVFPVTIPSTACATSNNMLGITYGYSRLNN